MSTYEALAAHFDTHFKDPRGLTYLTGNQVVGRLNEVLGPANWLFMVKEHGYDAESDEVWVLGRLDATIDGTVTVREQFGSQKHNRLRSSGKVIDYGFDLKGAATDAMKKCATLIGVGLYLSEKEGGIPQDVEPRVTPDRSAAPVEANTAPHVSATPPPRSTAGAAGGPDMITSIDDALYQRYASLVERAAAAEVEYEAIGLPVERRVVLAEGRRLVARVEAAEKAQKVAVNA